MSNKSCTLAYSDFEYWTESKNNGIIKLTVRNINVEYLAYITYFLVIKINRISWYGFLPEICIDQ